MVRTNRLRAAPLLAPAFSAAASCGLALCLVLVAGMAAASSSPPADAQGQAVLAFGSGLGLYREVSIEKGVALLKKAVELDPDEPLYAIYLADALYVGGQRKESNEVAAKISEKLRRSYMVHFFKAKRAQLTDDAETAEFELRESLLDEPTPYAFYELVALELGAGRLDDADADVEIALEWFPDDYYLLNQRGSVRYQQTRYADAIDAFNKAIESNGALPFARVNRGLAYYERGDYERALADYDAVLEAYPDVEKAKFFKALTLEKQRRYGAARDIIDKLVEAHPDDAGLWVVQGWLYYKTDKVREAEKILTKYVAQMPDDAEGHYKLATLYAGRRKTHNAFAKLRRALELDYAGTMRSIRADTEWDRYRDSKDFKALLEDSKPQ
jgi:tetratricopeptide (TPR) repeat protein